MRKIEKYVKEGEDGKCEGKGGRDVRAWARNRCREGFRRRQYFNRRQIYRPPAARPYEMASARVTCHFAKWSHASRSYLAVWLSVCLFGDSALSVTRYLGISSPLRLILMTNPRSVDSTMCWPCDRVIVSKYQNSVELFKKFYRQDTVMNISRFNALLRHVKMLGSLNGYGVRSFQLCFVP